MREWAWPSACIMVLVYFSLNSWMSHRERVVQIEACAARGGLLQAMDVGWGWPLQDRCIVDGKEFGK